MKPAALAAALAMALAAAALSTVPAAARPLVIRNQSPEIVTLVRIDRTTWHGRILPGASARVAELRGCLHSQFAQGTGDSTWRGSIDSCDGRDGAWVWYVD